MENRLGLSWCGIYGRLFVVSIVVATVFCGGMAMQAYRQNEDRISTMSDDNKSAIKAMPASMFEPKRVEWKAYINYGGGYRVEDESGRVVASEMGSGDTMRAAVAKSRAMRKAVKFSYWAETPDGLESEKPFGPECS